MDGIGWCMNMWWEEQSENICGCATQEWLKHRLYERKVSISMVLQTHRAQPEHREYLSQGCFSSQQRNTALQQVIQRINLLLWIALRRPWFLSINYCRSQQGQALLGWGLLPGIPFPEWVREELNVLLQYRPQRYRHDLHLSSKDAEPAHEYLIT